MDLIIPQQLLDLKETHSTIKDIVAYVDFIEVICKNYKNKDTFIDILLFANLNNFVCTQLLEEVEVEDDNQKVIGYEDIFYLKPINL